MNLPPRAADDALVVLKGSTWNKIRDHLHGFIGEKEQIMIGVKPDGERVISFANERLLALNENGVLTLYYVPMRTTE